MKNKGVFKERIRHFQPTWQKKGWDVTEYQCPVCKQYFSSYYGSVPNTLGVRLHITRIAKSECVAKSLGEMKKTPHFELWKKNTRPIQHTYQSREWIVS